MISLWHMSTANFDWNTQYNNDRDYKWLSTGQLTRILNRTNTPNAARVLDIGCGTGQLCRDLVHRGFRVRGVDISSVAIEQAKQSTILPSSRISFTVCDIEKDEIATNKFDTIFCKYVLAFVANKDSFLQKVASLKIQKGVLVVISPNIELLPDRKRNIAMKHQDVMDMLKKHFSNVSSELVDGDYVYYAR